jgi:hypothetical protein
MTTYRCSWCAKDGLIYDGHMGGEFTLIMCAACAVSRAPILGDTWTWTDKHWIDRNGFTLWTTHDGKRILAVCPSDIYCPQCFGTHP